MTEPRHDWDVPVLERMREDFRQIGERDARAASVGPPARRPRARPRVALAALLVILVAGVVLVDRRGTEALAGIRDAPRAAARAGSFAYRTVIEVTAPSGRTRAEQAGFVDLRGGAFAGRVASERGLVTERIGIGRELYFRARRRAQAGGTDAEWRRVSLDGAALGRASDAAATAAPVADRAIQALAQARGERVVGEDERVGGARVTHYRLAMGAATFFALRDADAERRLGDIRGVVDVWLDADDLPRRTVARFSSAGGRRVFAIDTRYASYGLDRRIQAPRSSRPLAGVPTVADPVLEDLAVTFRR